MSFKAELLNPELPVSELGEGPYWESLEQAFYWVDITGCRIHRYGWQARHSRTCTTPSPVGFVVPDHSGKLVAGLKDGIYRMDFGGTPEVLALPENLAPGCRFNDGKCDRQGRLWGGTMHLQPEANPPAGSLYRYDGKTLHTVEREIFIANGLGWSPDGATMYFTDTVRRVIWQYDYDAGTGTPSNKRVFKEFAGPGRPDGLAVDSQGRVLTAQWPGWGVEIFTPNGKPDGRIDLPVPQVSSCVFGGPDLKTLLITTAHSGLSAQQKSEAPLSGQVFAVEMDIAGLPGDRFTA